MRQVGLLAVFVICGATACGGSTPVAVVPQESQDQKKAVADAKSVVNEVYRTLNRTNTDGLMSLATEPLVVFGPRKTDSMATRTDALVALRAYVDAEKKFAVRSGSLVVAASPGGRSAWAVDVFVAQNDRVAMTAILSNADDIWLVTALALAQTPPAGTVKSSLKTDSVVPPGITGVAKSVDATSAAVERLVAGLANPKFMAEDLAREGAVAIGTSGEILRGKASISKAWAKRVKSHVRAVTAGDSSSGITPDGKLAYVTAPVVRFGEGEDPTPMRVFAIFERVDTAWRLVVFHEALAIDAPGSGKLYRSIEAPPIPVEAPPPKKDPKTPKKGPPPKKK